MMINEGAHPPGAHGGTGGAGSLSPVPHRGAAERNLENTRSGSEKHEGSLGVTSPNTGDLVRIRRRDRSGQEGALYQVKSRLAFACLGVCWGHRMYRWRAMHTPSYLLSGGSWV